MTRAEWIAGVVRKMNKVLALTRVVPFRIRFFAALLAAVVPAAAQAQPQPLACDVVTFDARGNVVSITRPAAAAPAALPGAAFLAEVNAKRATRGLRPYAYDAGLTAAAQACANFRAANLLFGHTSNDFAFVPPGTGCSSTGCAAYPPSFGWMSCDVYDNYTYAGAAAVTGRDGKRYMHLFVR